MGGAHRTDELVTEPGKTIEFWFDFSSPYAYFAAQDIDDLANRHGRRTVWRPFLLGALFKRTGMAPLTQQPLRGDYALRDWARLARWKGLNYRFPSRFPIAALAPSRMFYAVEQIDQVAAAGFAKLCFAAYFEQDRDISDPAIAADCGRAMGLDADELLALADQPECKALLRTRTEEAAAKGIFGAPFTIVDGEPFWGADRLPMVEDWLRTMG